MRIPVFWHLSLIVERLLTRRVHDLEYNPSTQYHFHRCFAIFWIITMIGIFFIPKFTDDLASMLIMQASLFANFATDFGAMSSSLAAMQQTRPPHCDGCRCLNKSFDY